MSEPKAQYNAGTEAKMSMPREEQEKVLADYAGLRRLEIAGIVGHANVVHFGPIAARLADALNAALEDNEALSEERDNFMLVALMQHYRASQHDINRFLSWLRDTPNVANLPDLVNAFFRDMADKSADLSKRERELVGNALDGWVPRAHKLEAERLAALSAGK